VRGLPALAQGCVDEAHVVAPKARASRSNVVYNTTLRCPSVARRDKSSVLEATMTFRVTCSVSLNTAIHRVMRGASGGGRGSPASSAISACNRGRDFCSHRAKPSRSFTGGVPSALNLRAYVRQMRLAACAQVWLVFVAADAPDADANTQQKRATATRIGGRNFLTVSVWSTAPVGTTQEGGVLACQAAGGALCTRVNLPDAEPWEAIAEPGRRDES
jgi:hypothetical protein